MKLLPKGAVLALFFALAACGGGGPSMPPPMPSHIPDNYTVRITQTPPSAGDLDAARAAAAFTADAEYNNQPGLALVKAPAAYGRGASGRDIIVGVMDSFLATGHVEFTDMPVDVRNDRRIEFTTQSGEKYFIPIGQDEDVSELTLPAQLNPALSQEDDFHGTMVTGTLAARRNAQGGGRIYTATNNFDFSVATGNMHGIAYESSVMFRSTFFAGRGPFFIDSADGLVEREDGTKVSVADLPDGLKNGESLQDIVWAQSFLDFIQGGARAVNISVGILAEGVQAGDEHLFAERLAERIPNILRALAEGSGKTIFVFAAGNQSGIDQSGIEVIAESPIADAALSYYFNELRGHTVSVVSVHPTSGVISDFSNRCGVAADWCMAAPGELIYVPWYFGPDTTLHLAPNTNLITNIGCPTPANIPPDPRDCEKASWYRNVQGTSFAAPMVTGGLALIMDLFGVDNYPIEDFLTRLYRTANKTGIYADRAIYGQGLMDLDAASRPLGTPGSLLGANIDAARRFELSQSRIYLGAAMGGSLTRALSGKKAVFFDDLDFAFPMDAAYYARGAQKEDGLTRLERFGRERRGRERRGRADGRRIVKKQMQNLSLFAGLNKTEFAPQAISLPPHGFFSLAENAFHGGARVSFGAHHVSSLLFISMNDEAVDISGDGESGKTYGLGLAYHFRPAAVSNGASNMAFNMEAGFLQEEDDLLSGDFGGLFALSPSRTLFASMGGEADISRAWRGFANLSLGWTDAGAARHGGLSGMTDIISSSWSAGAYRDNVLAKEDRLSLIIAQPLRVERGWADIHYTIGRTKERDLVSETVRSTLSPAGRALDMEARYQWGFLTLAASYSFQHGDNRNDDRNSKDEARLLARFSFNFQ